MLIFCYFFFHCCFNYFTSLFASSALGTISVFFGFFLLFLYLPQVVAGVQDARLCSLPLPFSRILLCFFFLLINLFKYKFVDLVVRFLL